MRKRARTTKEDDQTLFDWYERGKWLGRKVKNELIRDIPVKIVAPLLEMTVEQYLINMFDRGYLTGRAKEDAILLKNNPDKKFSDIINNSKQIKTKK